ncbi:MAG: hypothetical protein P4L33_18840 [Capsulimonadaceae bacterium]|nr:hypothetical protein [Capsulimonadaceae bacterium]
MIDENIAAFSALEPKNYSVVERLEILQTSTDDGSARTILRMVLRAEANDGRRLTMMFYGVHDFHVEAGHFPVEPGALEIHLLADYHSPTLRYLVFNGEQDTTFRFHCSGFEVALSEKQSGESVP